MMYCYKTGGIYQTVNGQGFYLHRMLAAKEFTKNYTKKKKGKKKTKTKTKRKKPDGNDSDNDNNNGTESRERDPQHGVKRTPPPLKMWLA